MPPTNTNPRAGDAGARQISFDHNANDINRHSASPQASLSAGTESQPAPKSLPAAFDDAKRALAECRNFDDAKLVRNKAIALAVYAKQAKDRSLIEDATAIRLRAERRAGEMLAEMEKNKGARGAGPGRGKKAVVARDRLLDTAPKLSDIGVTKTQSSNWQRLAALAPDVFEERVARGQRKAVNVLDGVARRTRQEMHADDEARVAQLRPLLGDTFLSLVIDFPWKSDWMSESAQASIGYATMAREQLFTLPIEQWAADNCHLYFLSPNNFLPLAFEAVKHYGERYGFAFKTLITWEKPTFGQGHFFRNQTEHCLFAVRGELRTRVDNIPTILRAPRGEDHSEKPEEFYDLVRAASYLPCGEAFQRQPRDGFVNLYVERGAP